MGLAAPKNRSKISNDPQNITWANNTTRFGHRILTSQGWQPGDALGATDASHAAHYTAASQSHIRVLLKDDNLGLGAKRGSERAENFGLAGLESILGRLNGKEEEVKKEEERRDEIEKRAFVYRKYGLMNFVSGGFLVGDKITTKVDNNKEPWSKIEVKSDKSTSKRKREEHAELDAGAERNEGEPVLKRKKKSMDLREEAREGVDSELAKTKKGKKRKSGGKDKSKTSPSPDPESLNLDITTSASDPELHTAKARRKAEKKVRREEKKLKKALKQAAKKAAKSSATNEEGCSESHGEESTTSVSNPTSVPTTGSSTPVLSSAGLTFNASNARGMHAVRQRWIRQKKAATMDAQAMKEIFMIKTPS
ncbi:hypothetical protein BKA66DRAFT_458890 [Pyrenochaeta sp. MPI-SDFR-AT-0127]|nr:hypothetical protein BKA66DRAFT_458890 [Pyrenochaeta sp. MPI-SDFR-AT-0127]